MAEPALLSCLKAVVKCIHSIEPRAIDDVAGAHVQYPSEFLPQQNAAGVHDNPAAVKIVSCAVAKVKRNDGRNWVPGGMPTREVDRIYGMLLLALKEGRTEAETDTSGQKQAVEVVQATLDSFFTAVLATVHAGAVTVHVVDVVLPPPTLSSDVELLQDSPIAKT